MKIILSRKGFDSSVGGVASPLFPDGTLLSLPIPDPQGYALTENLVDSVISSRLRRLTFNFLLG